MSEKVDIHKVKATVQEALDRVEDRRQRENERLAKISKKMATFSYDDVLSALGSAPSNPTTQQRRIVREVMNDFPDDPWASEGNPNEYLTEQFPQNSFEEEAPVPTRPQKQMLTEAPARKKTSNWVVKQYVGETKSGMQVPVWKVVNPSTGFSHQMLFRIEEIAQKIATFLNESGDFNDVRIVSLITAYKKRDALLKECRSLEKEAANKPMKQQRIKELKSQIAQLDYRLGI